MCEDVYKSRYASVFICNAYIYDENVIVCMQNIDTRHVWIYVEW